MIVIIIPNGTFFCGFFTSCAEVHIESKPLKARKTIEIPETIPEIPYSPKLPVFVGIYGIQLLTSM